VQGTPAVGVPFYTLPSTKGDGDAIPLALNTHSRMENQKIFWKHYPWEHTDFQHLSNRNSYR